MTTKELRKALADACGITAAQAKAVLDHLTAVAAQELATTGTFVLPDIARFKAVSTPAVPERDGINPFTKLPVKLKAKPASRKVRISPAKSLADALK